jgi:glyoxylase-like metal-dependent hydrolase (beta-lactamase superfamily II)
VEIVPGLHRLRTPMTSKALPWIMPYAFEGPDGVSLFDSGYGTPEATEWLAQQLHGIGYRPSDVRRLIVSHAHPDHVGMAAWIKEESPDCELVMLGREADWYAQMRHGPHHHGHDDFVARMQGWLASDASRRATRPATTTWTRGTSRRRPSAVRGRCRACRWTCGSRTAR